MEKAKAYGPVVLRLLVYLGRVAKITCQGHPLQKSWHAFYGTAWVPPNCGMVPSGLEENCIKSPGQVKVLGVSRGFSYLDYDERAMTRNCCSQRRQINN